MIAAQTKTHTILQLYKEIQKTNIDDNPLKSIMAPIRSQSILLLNSKSPDELKLFYLLQLLPGGLTADQVQKITGKCNIESVNGLIEFNLIQKQGNYF